MKKITVNASSVYDIIIGTNLIENAHSYINGYSKIAVITDDNVFPLYYEKLHNSLAKTKAEIISYVIPNGEQSKNINSFYEICEFLAENNFTRSDLIIALGGGVVGDLSGFVAASFLRGVDYIQVPTTLLAAVDSSVGGKTAIDIKGGKNLVGAFYQPKLVLCDTLTFDTLSPKIFKDGLGEVVKYAMIKSKELYDILLTQNPKDAIEDIVARCVDIKRQVVESDEKDRGERMILNFGHTLGHAVEKYYKYQTVTHGNAVCMGMVLITELFEKLGEVETGTTQKLKNLLEKLEIDYTTSISLPELYKLSTNDKKRFGDRINLVITPKIGEWQIKNTPIEEYKKLMESGE